MRRAVVLLSGGLDSATVLAIARSQGFESFTLAVDYGQRHRAELRSAAAVAAALGSARHTVLALDLRAVGGSALTDDVAVPKGRSDADIAQGIPITYVPARNTVLLALALGHAETLGAFDLFVGFNALDQSGYPDCRPAFVQAFERLANLATAASTESRGTFRIHTPLVTLDKAGIIREAVRLGQIDLLGLTLSCYDPDTEGRACGRCDACILRRQGFERADVVDPTRYASDVGRDQHPADG